jgi:hypothetical protein
MRFFLLFFLVGSFANAQLINNVQLEVVGKPSWQQTISLGDKGVLLFVKTDITRARIYKFDENLKQQWATDVFLDVERKSTSYFIDKEKITFLFRETQGLYYQVFVFDLNSGQSYNKGFELRDYFLDQDFVMVDKKIYLAGSNQEGAAFYIYDFETEKGSLVSGKILGKVINQGIKYIEEEKKIRAFWAVKTVGYANERKKKGEFTKDAFLVASVYDLNLDTLKTTRITQSKGRFPITVKAGEKDNGEFVLSGVYQSNTGDKGLYISFLDKNLNKKGEGSYNSFTKLLEGIPQFKADDIKKIMSQFSFLVHTPIVHKESIISGGVFFKPEYSNISSSYNNPAYNNQNSFGVGGLFGRNNRSQSRSVFAGYNYLSGIMLITSQTGDLVEKHRIDINLLNTQLGSTISFNQNGSVGYCAQGNLATQNFNIGTKPILYKLTEEKITDKTKLYLPSYDYVNYWYGDYFLAEGSKNKVEAISLKPIENDKPKRRKPKKSNNTYTQIRRTIYLTKVASGS